MTQDEAIEIIDECIARAKRLRLLTPYSAEWVAFVQTTGLELARIFGPSSAPSLNFNAIDYQSIGTFVSGFDVNTEITRRRAGAYQQGLVVAEGVLLSAREQLTRHGVDKILAGSRVRSDGPSVFISHGTESAALTRLERFVRAIGAQPVIVVRGPSEGLAVDDLVDKRLHECDCAIILATGDDDVGGRKQPRPNVLHEIGLAQEVCGNKVIYLKERGCEFPSNVQPKVWENFAQDNMEAAFEKVVKELRAFGLL